MVLLAHPQEATKPDNGKHDIVRELVQDNILDTPDFVAIRVFDTRPNDRLRANRVRCCSVHTHTNPPDVKQLSFV